MTSSTEGLDSDSAVVILGIVCGLAVLANLLVWLVLYRREIYRDATQMFMANLALADLLLAGVALPLKLNQAASNGADFIGGDAACKVVMFTPLFTIMCSICTMVATSFDRYFCIVYQKSLTRKRTAIVIGGIWVFSVLTSAPQLYEYSVYEKFEEGENETEIACGSHGIPENFETIYSGVILLVAYVIPLLLISINYAKVARFLNRLPDQIGSLGQSAHAQRTTAAYKGKTQGVKLLLTITALFALLWAPYFVLFTMEEITGTDDSSEAGSWPQTIKLTAIVLSTICNPLVYTAMNRRFRRGLRFLLTCGRSPGGATVTPVTVNVMPIGTGNAVRDSAGLQTTGVPTGSVGREAGVNVGQ